MWGQFKPSEALVKEIRDNLIKEVTNIPVDDWNAAPYTKAVLVTKLRSQSLPEQCKIFARDFADCIAMHAQRARFEPALKFVVVKNGRFDEFIDSDLGGDFAVPEGEKGDELMSKLAKEFLEWVRGNAVTFHPRNPIQKFVVEGDTIVAHVRPRDPPIHDSDFTPAEVVE